MIQFIHSFTMAKKKELGSMNHHLTLDKQGKSQTRLIIILRYNKQISDLAI